MGPLEQLAIDHHTKAAHEWGDAIARFTWAADEGEDFTAEEFARAAVAQHVYNWWQAVMNLINGEEADGAEAIMRTRRDAEQRLIHAQPVCHGELFSQAMAQARRQAAQQFLTTTQKLADALTRPGDPTGRAHGTSPASTTRAGYGHAHGPSPSRVDGPGPHTGTGSPRLTGAGDAASPARAAETDS